MKKLRLSSFRFFSALPFRPLANVDYLDYSEHGPYENAYLMNEGKLDVALIPITEYARHGGYVALDFGLASRKEIEGVMVFSNDPIEALDEIYVDEFSSIGYAMLRILLNDHWCVQPKLIRVRSNDLTSYIGERRGALMIGDLAINAKGRFKYKFDLSEAWHALTGLSFAYCIWAARPGVISRTQAQNLNDLFHKCVKARSFIAEDFVGRVDFSLDKIKQYITYTMAYYLDETFRAGINDFFERGYNAKLIPKAEYRSAKYNIINHVEISSHPDVPVMQLAEESLQGAPHSIWSGMRMQEELSASDLGLLLEGVRKRTDDRFIGRMRAVVHVEDLAELPVLEEYLCGAKAVGLRRLVLRCNDAERTSLEGWEKAIMYLSDTHGFQVTAFSVGQILALTRRSELDIKKTASRLVTAGLKGIGADNKNLLFLRDAENTVDATKELTDWLHVARWLMRFGSHITGHFVLDEQDGWEERFVHLERLRALQDEERLLRYFYIVNQDAETREPMQSEERLRSELLARLFLDNVRLSRELDLSADNVAEQILAINLNPSDVDISVPIRQLETLEQNQPLLDELGFAGIDLEHLEPIVEQASLH